VGRSGSFQKNFSEGEVSFISFEERFLPGGVTSFIRRFHEFFCWSTTILNFIGGGEKGISLTSGEGKRGALKLVVFGEKGKGVS